jgi:hypothetical protein
MVVPSDKGIAIIKNFVMVNDSTAQAQSQSIAKDHYKISVNSSEELVIGAKLNDGKALESVFRTESFFLKMLIRKAVIELRLHQEGNRVQRCAAYSVAS